MSTTIIRKNVLPEDRYKYYLKLVSAISSIKLSDLEIDILDLIYLQGGEINSTVRKKICETIESKVRGSNETQPMSEFNLTNYIVKLRKKKLIINDELISQLMIVLPENEMFPVTIEFISK
jgi:hypothetical protein